MKQLIDKKQLIATLIGIIITILVGWLLLQYEYKYLQQSSNNTITLIDNQKHQENQELVARSIYVSPYRRWQDKPIFQKKHYYMAYHIELNGNDVGFPDDTLIQISSKVGGIIKISGPKALRIKTHDGKEATLWNNEEFPQDIVSLFIDGPGKNLSGTLSIIVLSVGNPITDNDIKIISDSKDSFETLISYNENVE